MTSEPGKGSTFSFTASFLRAESAPRSTHEADPDLLRGRRVLVVDDNATNRLILDEQLAAWDMQPVSVASADEAMAALRSAAADDKPFEVAVLDMLLPDVDGLALARAIRAGSAEGSLHLLLLSSSHHLDRDAARAAGIAECLTKPVRQSELFDSLVNALSGEVAHHDLPAAAERGRGGVRVLVVEDNHVNQMVATGLLETAGYAVDVVADGIEAVDALAGRHGYAAVLMDCRMPRLDGFDATRAIRAREPDGERVPIIAMTASALEGEQERCLAAGMDDFLTKPVDPARLFRSLKKWTDGAATSQDPPRPREPALDSIVDLDRMRMLDSMRRDGSSLFDRASANFADERTRSARRDPERSRRRRCHGAGRHVPQAQGQRPQPRAAAGRRGRPGPGGPRRHGHHRRRRGPAVPARDGARPRPGRAREARRWRPLTSE